MAHLWQHPFVNVFKHYNIQTWKKSSKEGEVSSLMDRTQKCTVYRITGSIPAGNYIQFPKTSSQSLGLTGRFFYIAFKPIVSKYFVVHIDVATQDGLVVRISFSNLFREFKSTSTWLQFPFVCNAAAHGSISSATGVGGKSDQSGPAPVNTRWTLLSLDLKYILSMYLNRKYHYIKSIRLCANMFVKNVFTSDMDYDPSVSFEEARQRGGLADGKAPIPRDMSFPLSKTQDWFDLYDHIMFPSEFNRKPFETSPKSKSASSSRLGLHNSSANNNTALSPKVVRANKKTYSRLVNQLAEKEVKRKKKVVVSDLPAVGIDSMNLDDEGDDGINVTQTSRGDVHVYANPEDRITVHRTNSTTGIVTKSTVSGPTIFPAAETNYTSLKPDPILRLKRVVGFGGSSTRDVLWTVDGTTVVYPCHGLVVAMQANNGQQRFFIGHTDKISCITMNGNCSLLASGQSGPQSVVRVWNFKSGECLAMLKTHNHSLHCLSFSQKGNILCGVGKDGHNKNMVVVWNTDKVHNGGQVSVMSKAHTDVDIVRMRVAAFDETRMVSCGRDNVRVWRMKDGHLRSAPVNLGEYHSMEFTDCCYEVGYEGNKDPLDRLVYACSRTGHIFEIDYRKVVISHVRRLLPVDKKKKDKQTFNSGCGIAINSMCVNEAFCVTGSDDGFLRLWPIDFKHVFLEAEHEGPVTAVDISADGVRILAGTAMGNIGIMDIATRGYVTIMRSHTDRILACSMDNIRCQLATVSEDHTIRVWDLNTMQQLYDFTAPKECPCAIAYHPSQQVFACGFESGCVRVFNVATTSMLAEHKQHRGKVTGIAFHPMGDYMYSSGSMGSIALYDGSLNEYHLLRLLGNTVARGEQFGPSALSVSPDGKRVAFVGPTEFTVSVVDFSSLDEVMRIDITTTHPADSNRTVIDAASKVHFAPSNVKHLLVTTKLNKLLKFDARNGRILSEIANIHRSSNTALDVAVDGRHLATAGDKVIKIWDYHMRLDLNFQVFIGHSESINQLIFTPDSVGFISVGEAVMIWDFLAHSDPNPPMEGREPVKNYYTGNKELPNAYRTPIKGSIGGSEIDLPRDKPPRPAIYAPGEQIENFSAIEKSANGDIMGDEIRSVISDRDEDVIIIPPHFDGYRVSSGGVIVTEEHSDAEIAPHSPLVERHTPRKVHSGSKPTTPKTTPGRATTEGTPPKPAVLLRGKGPNVVKHFEAREKSHQLAQRRYTAPPNQAGIKLKSVLGYNGNGRGNMVWHADTGVFAYTNGCIVIVEDLSVGTQQHLMGHVEEISTLALQHDCQILASASGPTKTAGAQICLWDLNDMVCKKFLNYHQNDIVCLSYSRDDRFLISAGDYRDSTIVVWSTHTSEILTTTKTTLPVHDVKWDPYTVNEFASVGENGTVLFWLLDETQGNVTLNVHEADVPDDLLQTHHMGVEKVDFTCLEYAGDSTLYIGTSVGKLSAWDTRHNTCYMLWEADTAEICVIITKGGRLISGSANKTLRLWSVLAVPDLKQIGEDSKKIENSLSAGMQMEDEMSLDGSIISASFDDTMDMGIVGTSSGTLWYINWAERTSIRLVSGHSVKINGLVPNEGEYFATCADDGSLRVWSLKEREQTLQFQVMDQSCNCIAFAPKPLTTVGRQSTKEDGVDLSNIVAGYSDGTVRMFDVKHVEMVLKMQPHAVAVTAVSFSSDGRMILSGGSDGLLAISSPTTGITVRVINDHKGAPINSIDVAFAQNQDFGVSAPMLWLASSADRRVSVWSADWSKDFCEMIDWLTFPAPAFMPDGTTITRQDSGYFSSVPPSIAKFSIDEPDIVVYTGYGMQKQIQFYSLSSKKVLRTIALTHWATSLDLSPNGNLIAVGCDERLLKLIDYHEGSFQDFVGHNDSLQLVKFSTEGNTIFSTSYNEVIVWDVAV